MDSSSKEEASRAVRSHDVSTSTSMGSPSLAASKEGELSGPAGFVSLPAHRVEAIRLDELAYNNMPFRISRASTEAQQKSYVFRVTWLESQAPQGWTSPREPTAANGYWAAFSLDLLGSASKFHNVPVCHPFQRQSRMAVACKVLPRRTHFRQQSHKRWACAGPSSMSIRLQKDPLISSAPTSHPTPWPLSVPTLEPTTPHTGLHEHESSPLKPLSSGSPLMKDSPLDSYPIADLISSRVGSEAGSPLACANTGSFDDHLQPPQLVEDSPPSPASLDETLSAATSAALAPAVASTDLEMPPGRCSSPPADDGGSAQPCSDRSSPDIGLRDPMPESDVASVASLVSYLQPSSEADGSPGLVSPAVVSGLCAQPGVADSPSGSAASMPVQAAAPGTPARVRDNFTFSAHRSPHEAGTFLIAANHAMRYC
jgi:hypothetical protein